MAYEAALDAGVDAPLLALYESAVVRLDGAWYAEHIKGLGHRAQIEMEEKAASAAAPFIERYLSQTAADEYAHAPILTKDRWDAFMGSLELCSGDASLSVFPAEPRQQQQEQSYSQKGSEETSVLGGGAGGSRRPFQEQSAMLSARL